MYARRGQCIGGVAAMNILVIGKFFTDVFAMHIAETLAAQGYSVQRFEPGVKLHRIEGRIGQRLDQALSTVHGATDSIPRIRKRRMRGLWERLEEQRPEVVIVCYDFLWADEVAAIKRRTGASIAMWFPDHLANFGRAHFMNAAYDALFFKDPYIVHILRGRLASPVRYLPECFNPARHRLPEGEVIGPEYRCDITTAGNAHSWRVALYNQLGRYDVKLWGGPLPLWMPNGPAKAMHQGRSVMNDEKARAFLGAKIVLNNLHYGEIWGVNVRTFEAAGIGAFQIVDWRPAVDQLLDDGKEVVTFRHREDLLPMIDYWLRHDDERAAVARAGKRRAAAEHTYAHRLSLLLDSLAGRADGYPMPDIRSWI